MSYSREDKHVAHTVAAALVAEGFTVWWDAALRAGEAYDEVTERNLRQARAVVVLWSKRSVNSKWVRAEATVGERSSVLVPALIDDCDRPIRFELVQTADLTRWHGDRSDSKWRDFVADIRNAVGQHSASAAPSAPAPVAATASGDDVTIETTFWNSVKDGQDRSDFEAYLTRYPHGHFASLARNRVAALDRAQASAPPRPAAAAPRPAAARPAAAARPHAESKPAPKPAVAAKKKSSVFGAVLSAAALAAVVALIVTFVLMREDDAPESQVAAAQPAALSETALVAGAIEAPSTDALAAVDQDITTENADALEVSAEAEALLVVDGAPAEDGDALTPLAEEIAVEDAAPAAAAADGPGTTYRDCEACPLMARLSGGAFMMGSPSTEAGRNAYEGPQREVTLQPFAISVYEVTAAEWALCVADNACKSQRAGEDMKLPALGVSWRDATAYAKWLSKKTGKNYRLPTEAEWEYAARAGTTTAYWWGEKFDRKNAAVGSVQPVGSHEANAFQIYDMLGNAREWVEDCYVNNYREAPTNGAAVTQGGDCAMRVIRGGAWSSTATDMRVANRSRIGIDVRAGYMGVRLVSDTQ